MLPIETTSPTDAARAIVAGIIAGDEEIFPDKVSQGTGPAFFADPKGLERRVAGVPAAGALREDAGAASEPRQSGMGALEFSTRS